MFAEWELHAVNGDITLKELARLANLSVNTISRALNDRDGVSPETRRQVKELAQQYHYRPNMMARSMRGASSNMVGVLLCDLSDSFFVKLLSGVEEELARASMPILIGNANENAARQRECLELFLSYHCKDIIIAPVVGDTTFLDFLRAEGVNFVLADRTQPDLTDCNQVDINIRRDAFRAVEHLIRCGHRRIAIVNQLSTVFTETERTAGYQDALQAYGLAEDPALIRCCRSPKEAAAACAELMSLPHPPTALFLAKDTLAMSAVSRLYSLGLHIPDDVSVLIYGNPEWATFQRPWLSCMERSIQDIGRTSARILIERMKVKRPLDPLHISFDSNLILRDSIRIL